MADKETLNCSLRYKFQLGEKRTIGCCYARAGFMIKMWKCKGRSSPECPLVIWKNGGPEPVVGAIRISQYPRFSRDLLSAPLPSEPEDK